jgi:8-oxo-dGTP pyrophosphatase MutT (NUDIX family)/phosphohistidine phosphatase SixA
MPDRTQLPEIRAAGAVPWRPGASGPEVALVHRPRYDDWSFPKGKSQPGEHVLATAVREVREETGFRIVLGRRLSPADYLSEGRPKRVDYWAAHPAEDGSGPPGPAVAFVPNDEVDDLAWLPLAAARDRLTYPHDNEVLGEFAAGPAVTAAFILVRHTSARIKKAWRDHGHRDDLDRPLTARGQAQAVHLAGLLCCFGPARVISSAAQRCMATVQPYATLAGTKVEAEPAFTLAAGDAPGAGTWMATGVARQRIADLVAAGEPVVICGHRENLPSLLAWVCEELAAPVPHGPPLPKGSFWVLHTSTGQLVTAEQHHLGA